MIRQSPVVPGCGASRCLLLLLSLAAFLACDRSSLPSATDGAVAPPSSPGDGAGPADTALGATGTPDSARPSPDVGADLAAADPAPDAAPGLVADAAPAADGSALDAPNSPDSARDLRADAGTDAARDLATPDAAPDLVADAAPDLAADTALLLAATPGAVMQDRSQATTIELYGVDPGHQLVRRGGLGSAGIDPLALGSPTGVTLQGTPAPLSWAKGRLDIFALGSDKLLYQRWYNGAWQPWVTIAGVKLSSDPSICSWGVERLDLFARGEQDGDLQHLWYDHGWSARGWETLGGQLGSAPSSIALAVNRIDIFARDPGDKLVHLAYDNGWLPWDSPGDALALGPEVTSRKAGIIEVYATEANHHLRFFEWTPASRGPWRDAGFDVPGDFRVVTVAPRRVLVLSRLPSGEVWQRFLDHTD